MNEWLQQIVQDLPLFLQDKIFLLDNWRWLALLLLIAVGVVADRFATLFLRRLMAAWLKRRRADDYAAVEDKENRLRPFGMLLMVIVWWLGLINLGLPEKPLFVLLIAVKALASMAAVWSAYRLVDIVSAWLTVCAAKTDNKLDDLLVPLIPRTLKIFVTVMGVVFVADNLNLDITGLLAGLGLGGLAFALAAKDMVQNLFGSVTVLLDRTFTVGDWIVVDKYEGTVERVGFRSTRIRTFYNSLVSIPNALFMTAQVDNMGERRYRRYKAHFDLTYDTPPERVEAFCEGIRELVRQHPYMRKDNYHVYLNEFSGSSLAILVYVFWETPDWATELRERHRFLLDCLRLVKQLDIEFAFPTRTLYMREEEYTEPFANGEVGEGLEQARLAARDIATVHKP